VPGEWQILSFDPTSERRLVESALGGIIDVGESREACTDRVAKVRQKRAIRSDWHQGGTTQ
jgi:hypothetical protein